MQRQPSINYYRFAPALFLLSFVLCLFSACNPGGELQDGEIDSDLRAEIDALNKKVVSALANNKPDQILTLCSDDFLKVPTHKKALKELAADTKGAFQPEDFVIRKQFYERRRMKSGTVNASTGGDGDHDYIYKYETLTRRSFVTIGFVEDSVRTLAILTVYGNYNGTWKLNILNVGGIKAFGKDAIDWYYKARQQYADNALADAHNSASMCETLLKPGGEGWHYLREEDMASLKKQIESTAEMKLSFPILAENVATKPRIFGVTASVFNEGYLPTVAYATKLPFFDSLALARECDSLNVHIGGIFEGLDHYNKTIIYHIYPHVPERESDSASIYHSMVRKSAGGWFY